MHVSYQIKNIRFEKPNGFHEIGRNQENENSNRVLEALSSFVTPDGEVDAAKMMVNWFPTVESDVFISHSRLDKDLALTLSGWLLECFGLKSFIDSCAWGHANDLLKQIDDKVCTTGPNLYSYEKSIITASHVHLMLSSALTQMMDRCECIFFLNTENSLKTISIKEMAEWREGDITQSPWLFHEISMMKMLRIRKKKRTPTAPAEGG